MCRLRSLWPCGRVTCVKGPRPRHTLEPPLGVPFCTRSPAVVAWGRLPSGFVAAQAHALTLKQWRCATWLLLILVCYLIRPLAAIDTRGRRGFRTWGRDHGQVEAEGSVGPVPGLQVTSLCTLLRWLRQDRETRLSQSSCLTLTTAGAPCPSRWGSQRLHSSSRRLSAHPAGRLAGCTGRACHVLCGAPCAHDCWGCPWSPRHRPRRHWGVGRSALPPGLPLPPPTNSRCPLGIQELVLPQGWWFAPTW